MKLLIATRALAALMIAASASATLIVDDFSFSELGGEYSPPELCGHGIPESAGSTILGQAGTRTVATSRTSVVGGCLYAAINQGGITGDLSIASDPDSAGTVTVIGRGGPSLVPADATHLTVRAFSDTTALLQVFLYISTAGYVGGSPFSVSVQQFTDYSFSLNDFVGVRPGETIFDGYLLVVHTTGGASAFIDEISIGRPLSGGPASSVPEPATGVAMAAGLMAVSAIRMRRG